MLAVPEECDGVFAVMDVLLTTVTPVADVPPLSPLLRKENRCR